MHFASAATARTLFFDRLSVRTATTEGSLRTMPLPFTYTNVLAVPKSMAKSLDILPKSAFNTLHVSYRLVFYDVLRTGE
jgi:hypothetical protein